MARLFGTDGVRGIAGKDLDSVLAYKLGRAGAFVLTEGSRHPKILIVRDTRISGTMLEAAMAAGICSVGGTPVLGGVLPTPGCAYLVRELEMDAGIVISASHNPMEFNGIKFFNRDGYKLPDETEDRIEAYATDHEEEIPSATGEDIGAVTTLENAAEIYARHLASRVKKDLSKYRVVLDCANGAVSDIAPRLFASLGLDVVSMFNRPDGQNINRDCGSTHMEQLVEYCMNNRADLGLAFDGDGDRMLAVDETGTLVNGDEIMMIVACSLARAGKLAGNTVVATVMSNLGMTIAAREQGIRLERTAVGDRYVLQRMMEKGYVLGGEQSGHIIFLEDNTTGDGLNTALRLLEVMAETGEPLSKLAGIMENLPQVLVNVSVTPEGKSAWEKDEEIKAAISAVREKHGEQGNLLVRASGTEPLIRVMMEGRNKEEIEEDANALAALFRKKYGVATSGYI